MTKTFNISCDIELFNEFKQLINKRNEKVSTVIQDYMKAEIIQEKNKYSDLIHRIELLEEHMIELLDNKDIDNV